MNGEYLLSNLNTDSSSEWDSNYAKFEVWDPTDHKIY